MQTGTPRGIVRQVRHANSIPFASAKVGGTLGNEFYDQLRIEAINAPVRRSVPPKQKASVGDRYWIQA